MPVSAYAIMELVLEWVFRLLCYSTRMMVRMMRMMVGMMRTM
jgi:hypothetical protein